ncbi:MAG: TrkH family potassium uptake protein [Nocardioides sp.]
MLRESRATRRRDRYRLVRHPAQAIALGFAGAIAVGTLLLLLPAARSGPGRASFVEALFTSTSATCVTGLAIVDTESYWSGFGEAVIMVLIQLGGLGIMTTTSLLGLIVARRMGLRTRLTAAMETKSLGLRDMRGVVIGVVKLSLLFEFLLAAVLTLRLFLAYDEPLGRAAYLGVFHAVSAFNNAGFALYSDNLIRFVSDAWVCLPIALAVIVGGLGFPVLFELRRAFREPRRWSLHTKMTIVGTGVLLVAGTLMVMLGEWRNPRTLGALDLPGRLLASFFQSVMPRTAGFNTLDYGQMNEDTLLGTNVLMFIGGGSAGTAGGIKVATFFLLLFVIVAEVRGRDHVHVFDRHVDDRVIRQALTVALLSVAAVIGVTLVLLAITSYSTDVVLFEATSAFATVGLSTGITAALPPTGHYLLIGLMFLGRLGPVTLVTALALRERQLRYELPKGRPIIG